MKNKQVKTVSVWISAVYIFTFFIYVFLLCFEYTTGTKRTQEQFSEVTRAISKSLRNAKPGSKNFYNTLLDSLDSMENIESLSITLNKKPILLYPSNTSIENLNSTSIFTEFYSSGINTPDGDLINFAVSIYKLKPSSIFYKGLIASLIIFIATAVTAVYLFTIKDGKEDEEETQENEKDGTGAEDKILNSIDYDAKPEVKAALENSKNTQKDVTSPQAEPAQVAEPALETEPAKTQNEEKETAPEQNESKEHGLFNPTTGFGWQSYLIPRLDKELIRAASSEQDLALITLRIPNIDWNTEAAKKISSLIIKTFKFDDLVFDYKTDGCCAIIQNEGTDSTIQIAENLHTNILSIIKEEKLDLNVNIGISTRSLRLISGERLARESEEALAHAMKDKESPIIAFRVNPEKYRAFLANQAEL